MSNHNLSEASPPRTFLFRCDNCGEHAVSQDTAEKFLTSKLKKELRGELKKGAHGAVLTFRGKCPICSPDSPGTEIVLSALWPKIN